MAPLVDYTSDTITFKDGKAYLRAIDGKEEEIFKGCLMIPETDLSAAQISVLASLPPADSKKKFRGIWYMAATLTPDEVETLASFNQDKKGTYLHYLCEQCDEGERPCYELIPGRKPAISPEDLNKKLEAVHGRMMTMETMELYY